MLVYVIFIIRPECKQNNRLSRSYSIRWNSSTLRINSILPRYNWETWMLDHRSSRNYNKKNIRHLVSRIPVLAMLYQYDIVQSCPTPKLHALGRVSTSFQPRKSATSIKTSLLFLELRRFGNWIVHQKLRALETSIFSIFFQNYF